jgi:cytochrome c oxidase subunit 1
VISAIGFGGLGGLFLGTQISDNYLHETAFVVGHFHLMIGTVTLLSIFGAIYFWFPKWTGRTMSDRLGRWHFWLTAVPMLLIFVLMHMQGLGGMLRRTYNPEVYEYNEGNVALKLPITFLAFALFAGQAVFLWNFFRSAFRGEKAGPNPWEATTLEWAAAPSPAPHGNFGEALPVVHRWAYEYSLEPEGPDFIPQTVEKGA